MQVRLLQSLETSLLFSPTAPAKKNTEWLTDMFRSSGYYTGLYEGKQKALQEQPQK